MLTQTTKTHAGCVCMEKQKRVKVSYNNAILYEADINRQTDRQTDRCNTHTHTIKETTRWMCVHGNDKKKQNVFYNYALLVSSRHEWTDGQTHTQTYVSPSASWNCRSSVVMLATKRRAMFNIFDCCGFRPEGATEK